MNVKRKKKEEEEETISSPQYGVEFQPFTNNCWLGYLLVRW